MLKSEKRIVVDWDGTCVEEKYPDMGDWLPGAVETLRWLLDEGYEVVILTTRVAPYELDELTLRNYGLPDEERFKILRMLKEAGLHEAWVWDGTWKPRGKYYIDDRSIPPFGSWEYVKEYISNRNGKD